MAMFYTEPGPFISFALDSSLLLHQTLHCFCVYNHSPCLNCLSLVDHPCPSTQSNIYMQVSDYTQSTFDVTCSYFNLTLNILTIRILQMVEQPCPQKIQKPACVCLLVLVILQLSRKKLFSYYKQRYYELIEVNLLTLKYKESLNQIVCFRLICLISIQDSS